MITEQALLEAIAECQGERNPNALTCRNLAAFYTILDHVSQEPPVEIQPVQSYSYDVEPRYTGSDLSVAIQEYGLSKVLPVLDDLLDTVQMTNPRLYASFLRKLNRPE